MTNELKRQAISNIDKGNYDIAIAKLNDCIGYSKEEPFELSEIYVLMGNVNEELGNFNYANHYYASAVNTFPENPLANFTYGTFLHEKGEELKVKNYKDLVKTYLIKAAELDVAFRDTSYETLDSIAASTDELGLAVNQYEQINSSKGIDSDLSITPEKIGQ